MAKTKQIPHRPKTQQPAKQTSGRTAALARWKPRGPFRFLDLPPELRTHILELAILDWTSHRSVLNLFLTSRALYAEAASVFYHEVLLDSRSITKNNTHLVKKRKKKQPGADTDADDANPFLSAPLTPLSPRLHVRALTLRFRAEDQLRVFGALYASALRAMASRGALRSLRLEVESKFPADDFWGGNAASTSSFFASPAGDYDLFCDDAELRNGNEGEGEVWAPAFVAHHAFQAFLAFLRDSGVPRLTLYVQAAAHHRLWCPYHRTRASGAAPCEGEWPGKAVLLKVDRKRLVRTLLGVRIAGP
ncbi:hypothetical protein F4810DRAFT_404175 [Camillea tinctor]|nr:hypothetical protein F4810DRAFT_404175 [Camillea tinctor]